VEDHRPVGRTAHPRIRDPHHVRHPYHHHITLIDRR
jgi:hypothetical protein